MILYNVTVNIDYAVHEEWLEWMKREHIPEVMATGLFTEPRMLRLMGDTEPGGITYSIQYLCKSMEDLQRYQSEHAPGLQAKHTQRYKDKFTAFRTVLEVVK